MTPQELEELGTAAFGGDWKVALAGELNCSREMLWRYVTGRTPIPDYQVIQIRKVCKRAITQQIAKLEKLLRNLAQAA